MTAAQFSACMFVKLIAADADRLAGILPTRATQKRAADIVRHLFFEQKPMKKIVIGFSGLAGAGKSTAARVLREERGFTVLPFAGPLKAMALDLGFSAGEIGFGKEGPFDWFSLPPELSNRNALRAFGRLAPLGWAHPAVADAPRPSLAGKSVNQVIADIQSWYAADRSSWATPRQFLQRLGTEWGRQRISTELWVEAWRCALGESAAEHFGDILAVADDVRFENEAAAIRAEGGIIVRVERAGAGSATGAAHSSEAGVAADIALTNDGDPQEFAVKVLGLLDRWFAEEAI